MPAQKRWERKKSGKAKEAKKIQKAKLGLLAEKKPLPPEIKYKIRPQDKPAKLPKSLQHFFDAKQFNAFVDFKKAVLTTKGPRLRKKSELKQMENTVKAVIALIAEQRPDFLEHPQAGEMITTVGCLVAHKKIANEALISWFEKLPTLSLFTKRVALSRRRGRK